MFAHLLEVFVLNPRKLSTVQLTMRWTSLLLGKRPWAVGIKDNSCQFAVSIVSYSDHGQFFNFHKHVKDS